MNEEGQAWDLDLESVASAMLRGAKVWQVAQMLDCDVEEAEARIAQVTALWEREAGLDAEEGPGRSLAQLRRVQLRAWERWDDNKDPKWLRLALDAEQQVIELRGDLERSALPSWVSAYLAAWGMKRKDGKRMLVRIAAEMAGTTDSTVRDLRMRSAQFKRMEFMARHGSIEDAAEYIDAGLRGSAPLIFQRFMRALEEGNTQILVKAMTWLRGESDEAAIRITPEIKIYIPDNERDDRSTIGATD